MEGRRHRQQAHRRPRLLETQRLPRATDAVACTLVAKPNLAHARALAASWRQQHPEVPFVVGLTDEPEGCFAPAREPFEVVELPALTAQVWSACPTGRSCGGSSIGGSTGCAPCPDAAREAHLALGTAATEHGDPFRSGPDRFARGSRRRDDLRDAGSGGGLGHSAGIGSARGIVPSTRAAERGLLPSRRPEVRPALGRSVGGSHRHGHWGGEARWTWPRRAGRPSPVGHRRGRMLRRGIHDGTGPDQRPGQ